MTRQKPVALVTGGRRGIGAGIAVALAGAGFDIAIVDLEEDDAAGRTLDAVAAAGAKARFLRGDIADVAGHDALLDAAWVAFGSVDCLVNNAGVSVLVRGDLLEASLESYDRCLDTNLRGPFFLTQNMARRMLAEAAPAWHRSIVTITSISAEVISTARGEYCISKAGLSMMSRLFAVRLAETGIGVYEIRPGIVRSEMTRVSEARLDALIAEGYTPIRRWGEPEDVGRTAATLATGGLPYAVGQVIYTDGGLALRTL
ncbi:MAG: 3-ketoacyl-ACP reductase [Geminicoccaceae bacterium]